MSEYNTSTTFIMELVGSLIGDNALNYVVHRDCVQDAGTGARKEKMCRETKKMYRRKELAGVQERNCIYSVMRNGAWLNAIPHLPNSTELSWEDFQDKLHPRYGLMPQGIPVT